MAFSQFGGGGGAVGHRPGEPGYQGGYGSRSSAPIETKETNNSARDASGFNNPATNPTYGKSTVQDDQIKSGPR